MSLSTSLTSSRTGVLLTWNTQPLILWHRQQNSKNYNDSLINSKGFKQKRSYYNNWVKFPYLDVLNNCVIASLERKLIMHVDFEPIYTETYRKSSMPLYFRAFGRKPLFHVISSQFKVTEAWELEMNKS